MSVSSGQNSSSQKRQRDSSPIPSSSAQSVGAKRLAIGSKEPVQTEVKKIDDLNKETLVQIFEWLNFTDLCNVANTSKKLREAAGSIYAQKYADKMVKFNGDALKKDLMLIVTAQTIEVNDARACLKMFRAFGNLIKKLWLNFKGIGPNRSHAISKTLNNYCAKTLTDLEWHYCPADAMDDSSKKFLKLTCLRMTFGCLGQPMSQFNELFPALCRLELNHIAVADGKCLEFTFSKLTHLKVHIEPRKGRNFLMSQVKAALRMNPQIRTLSLGSGCEVKMLAFINEMLPLLNTFEIQNPRNKFFDSDEDVVRFKNVKHFFLDIVNCTDSITNIPFKFKRLQRFTLKACPRDKWVEFAALNQHLVELSLLRFNWFYFMDGKPLMKLAKLPNLRHFILDWRVKSPLLLQFIDRCIPLQKIQLTLRTQLEQDTICNKIDNGWDINIDEHFLTLQRTV